MPQPDEPVDFQQNRVFWLQHEHFDYDENGNGAWLERVSFALRAVYDVVAAPGWCIVAPIQPQSEIWLVRSGRVEIQLGSRSAMLHTGEIGILPSGLKRDTREVGGAPLSIIGFSFDATLLGAFEVLSLLEAPLRLSPDERTHMRLESLLNCITRESREARAGFSFAASGWAKIAFIETVRAALSETEIESRLQKRLQSVLAPEIADVLEFMAANFASHLELGDMASRAHLSPQHFSRKFKTATGASPMAYLHRLRLEKASTLLTVTERPIADIAFHCGFPDASYFSRAFKSYSGLSPLEFRRQSRAFSAKTS